ncbi:major facilitator superfamily domain-containing protein [Astrocystis sublimbata]|nr:major facilitator superfamily domain-containing protein [Astrocystis sublimbata]
MMYESDSKRTEPSASTLENISSPQPAQHSKVEIDESSPTKPRSWRFSLVFVSLCLLSFASALDGSIITTALPTITRELGVGTAQNYIWLANSFTLAQTVIQPPLGQLCDLVGRRVPMFVSLVLFTIGSGIAGGASNVSMIIAGRTVQGLGSGGIYLLVDLVVCDLVSLRDRGKYLGIVLSTAAVAAILGPVVGGGLAQANWRWVFYINIPLAGLVLLIMWAFLDIPYKKSSVASIARRVDWIGNLIFMASITSILLGLIFGGGLAPWRSTKVIVPLVLGGLGYISFHVFEASPWCPYPSVPPRLFNRDSNIGFILAFIAAVLLQWSIYFLPIYFQGVKGTTPLISGVDTLPYNAFLIPAAMLAGGLMSKFGIYKLLHHIGFGFLALGLGLFSILTARSPTVLWVVFQLFTAIGQGCLATTILPGIQAALPSSDIAVATGMYAFLRSFGFVWGVTIPSIIFNSVVASNLFMISDPVVRTKLSDARAYSGASDIYRTDLPEAVQLEVKGVYVAALAAVWYAAAALAIVGLLLSFGSRQLELRSSFAESSENMQDPPHDDKPGQKS